MISLCVKNCIGNFCKMLLWYYFILLGCVSLCVFVFENGKFNYDSLIISFCGV